MWVTGWRSIRAHSKANPFSLDLARSSVAGGASGLGSSGKASIMARRYFGTDGIRGRANSQITADMALKAGQAAGLVFRRGDPPPPGGDRQGYAALELHDRICAGRGFASWASTSASWPSIDAGCRHADALDALRLGGMISASHNPY